MPLLLALACVLIYNANLRQIGAGDTLSARYLPLMFWHAGTLEVDAHARMFANGHPMALPRFRPANEHGKAIYYEPTAYWMVRTRDHKLASFYPIVTPMLVAPLYMPAALWLDANGWEQPHIDRIAEWMEKLVASLLAAAASVIVFLILRREGNSWALPLALAFAFGTNTWMISSQALWQHGTGELMIASALLLTLVQPSAVRLMLLGAVCILICANRPPDALVAVALGAFVLWRDWRSVSSLIAGAAVPAIFFLYYNVSFMGDIAGGYGVVKPPGNFFQSDWSGLAGLLVSPTRGLLVFSPFLAVVVIGIVQRFRSPSTRVLTVLLTAAVVGQLLLYAQGDWRAGTAWGPRWLTDILPILIWLLAPAPLVLRPMARGVFAVAIVMSVGAQTAGAFWYTKASDERIFAGDPASMRGAWDLGNLPYLTELQQPPASAELLCNSMATVDKIGRMRLPSAGELPRLELGTVLEGWALACARTPAQLLVLINGVVIGTTSEFLSRVDVNQTMQTSAASGWRIEANLWGVPSGEQILQLAVRIDPRSDFRIVREQKVIVATPPPAMSTDDPKQPSSALTLSEFAARATSRLKEHQTDYGAWLTAHTTGLRYEAAMPEMNTFLTSTLVDLLAPLAQRHDLDSALILAREHLAAQIESDGLVRYHGLPNGPTIGTLGCAITPDADDTALAWRVAGPGMDDPRLKPMLSVLAGYRDSRGLYRTWLATQNNYQCLDPGSDPNPTDITIQLNVYLMLRELDPSAGQALCHALQRSIRDEDIWVYYAKSALIPYLRVAELAQLGCALPLPTERLALPAAGQEIWSDVAHWLVRAAESPNDEEPKRHARRLLTHIAANDFELIRHSPPLLYHNDLSATVRRFYWSEDVGYAFWLRLYETAEHGANPDAQSAR